MEYNPYSGILFIHKKDKVLIRATIWMSLENMFNERNQTPKVMYYLIPFIWNIQERQIHRDKKEIRWGGVWIGEQRVTIIGTGFLSGVMKMFWNFWRWKSVNILKPLCSIFKGMNFVVCKLNLNESVIKS